MLHLNKTILKATEKTKRRSDVKCKDCREMILVGNKYISVVYDDGFITRGYGAFHIQCWEDSNKK